MELRENMYIRYVPTLGEYTQKISKITNIKNCMLDMCYTLDNKEKVFNSHFDEIIKASNKPIDVLKVGDFLDNHCIVKIKNNTCYMNDGWFIDGNDIEDLVTFICTKEMFEQMSYKVGE